jgi:hypothetical protein
MTKAEVIRIIGERLDSPDQSGLTFKLRNSMR